MKWLGIVRSCTSNYAITGGMNASTSISHDFYYPSCLVITSWMTVHSFVKPEVTRNATLTTELTTEW